MAKDKESNFDKNKVEKTSSWFKNVAKSLGYAGYASIGESMPFVINTFEDNKELIADAKRIFKSRSSVRLSNIIGDTAAKNIGSVRTGWNNALSDIKSGKIYNKGRIDEARRASSGFGDEDWDTDFSDSDDGFSIDVDEDYDEETDTTTPHITVNANITEDNPMVTAIHGQSDIIIETSKINAKNNAVIADLQIKSMNSAMSQLHGAISTVNDNVSQIVEFNSNKMDSYVGASLNFYENQIKLMGELIESVRSLNKPASREVKKYESPYDNLLGMSGGFSVAEYGKLVKKQLNEALDANIFTGSIKTMLGTEDAFLEIMANPLGFIPKTVISAMIPTMTKKIMESFNNSFESFIPVMFNKIYEWGDRKDDPLGIAKLIGSTFGIKTHAKTTIDSSKYEKGAIPFDGVTKKAIVSVIPTYLRKILAHMTGQDELVYNSEKGKWIKLNTVKKTYDDELNRVATRSYSDIYDIKDQVNKLNLDPDQTKKFNESIDNFFANLSKSNKRFNPNEIEGTYDLIKTLFKDNKGNTDEDMSEVFRKIIRYLPKSTQMRIAKEQLEGRVNVTNWIREREMNPDTISDIVHSDILDRKLYKTQQEINAEQREREERERERRRNDRTIYSPLSTYQGYGQSDMNRYLESREDTIEEDPSENTGIKGWLGRKFSGITKAINKTFISADNAMYRLAFGSYDETGNIDHRSIFEKIADSIVSKFNWFKDQFGKLNERLIGDDGILTKLEQTEFMKKVKRGFGKTRDYLFGKRNADGTFENGLLSDVGNELVGMKNKVKDYIMGPDNENSVLNNIKSMFGSFKNSVKEFLFGDKDADVKEKAKGVLTDFGGALKDGFQSFANAFFGTKDKLNNGQLQNKINIDELTNKLKENAPKAIAGGIVGGGLGLIAGAGGFGLLGSLFLGPLSGVVLGVGTSLLSRSEKFKNMLFGENDENGERTGGFISKSVQNFFKDNKNYLLGGAALGTLHGLLGGLGILPSLVAGGPITGALIGLGAGILRKSEAFQSFMFGDLEEDGKRRNGLITKITNSFNSDQAMKKLGHAGAGAIIGGIGGAALSSFGVLGSLSLGPLGGAIIGAGAGIALAADKWKEKIFGKFDENGNRVEAGLLSKLAVMTSVNVLQPLKYKTLEWRFGVENWFEQKIALPIMEAVAPIKEEFRRIGNKLVDFIGGVAEAFHIPDIANGFKTHLFNPLVNTVKTVSNAAIEGIGKATGWILQKPVQLISMVVDRLIVPKHMRQGLRDARKMILKNIIDSKPGQVITKTVSTVGNFTKGVISGVGDFAKSVITNTFKFLGKGLLAVVKAPFQAIAAPVKVIGSIGDMIKYRKNRNYGSPDGLYDIQAGNRGFFGSIGDLAQTFNPFSNIRASARNQYVNMDALRERAIKEKFTDENGNIIPHTEKELQKEVNRLARKYPGGAGYQEERMEKAIEYRDKIKDRAKKRKDILDQYRDKVKSHQDIASGLGYNLLTDEEKESVSLKDLNKIEDSVYKSLYGKDYKNKSKIEQDNFKNQRASQEATVNMSNDVKDIRNALLGQGANVTVTNPPDDNPPIDNPITAPTGNNMIDFATSGMTEEHRDAVDKLKQDSSDKDAPNPITDPINTSSSDSMIDFATSGMSDAHRSALGRLNNRSEEENYRRDFKTLGETAAEQKAEKEQEDKDKERSNFYDKLLGSVEHGNETRDKSAFDWGRIFGKTGLITAGLVAALPFILNFFKDPSGALSGLIGGIGNSIREFLGYNDNNGDRTDNTGNTQVNSDAEEAMVRGGGAVVSSGLRLGSEALKGLQQTTKGVKNTWSKIAETTSKNADDSGKIIAKLMNMLKTLPSKVGNFIKQKFPKAAGAADNVISLVSKATSKISKKVLQRYFPRMGRAIAYLIPGANIVAAGLDIGFVAYGMLSGGTKSETANLFHVNQDDVTAGMRVVSSGLKGALNFSWFFLLAIVNDILIDMIGYDVLHNIALLVYKVLPFTDDEKIDAAIADFTVEYDQYTLEEQIKKGNVMYDESGNIMYNEDGSLMLAEGAQVESFDSFNDRQNKTLWESMKEKITGKKNNLTDEEKKERIANVEEAYKNGAIDEKTYKEMIDEINGNTGFLAKINNFGAGAVKGVKNFGSWLFGTKGDKEAYASKQDELNALQAKHKAGEIDDETYNTEADKLKEELDKLAGKEGAITKLAGKIGSMGASVNTAASKFLNEPLLDEDGNPVTDKLTGKPVMKHELANFIKHGYAAIPGMASRIANNVSKAADEWWNGQATDENGQPLVDERTGYPIYNSKLHNILTNDLSYVSKKVNDFGANVFKSAKDWLDEKLGGEDGEFTVSDIGSFISNKFTSVSKAVNDFGSNIYTSVKNWLGEELAGDDGKFTVSDIGNFLSKKITSASNAINDFGSGIFDSVKNWWDTEIKDPDGEKFKISDIGKYTGKIFKSLTSKVVDFFDGLWNGSNTDGNTTTSRELATGVTTGSGETGWYDWDNSSGSGGHIGGPTNSSEVPDSTGEKKKGNSTTTSSSDYNKKIKELFGLYRVTSEYGYRPKFGSYHYGIDLYKTPNSDVPAFTAGTVTKTTTDAPPNSGGHPNYYVGSGKSYGNHVVIKDDRGNYNYYAHLNKVKVQPGQKVSVGQSVGLLGHTGHSTNSHLHYEVRDSSNKYKSGWNPRNYLFGNYSTSDIGNNYNYNGGSSDISSTSTTTIPAPDYLGLTTMANAISEKLTTSLEPFTAMADTMNKQLGDYYGTNPATTVTTSSGDSGSFGSTSSGNSGSAEANAKRVYRALKAYGIPDVNIAGVLGNWTHESGIDPTGVEGIYSEKYTMGPKKSAAMANPQSYTLNTLFPKYAGKSINKKAYIGEDGLYYPGIGLGGFTGPAATKLMRFAKQKGMNWYDLDPQIQYSAVPTSQGGYRNFMSNWKSPESSPAMAARVFLQKWEGINPDIGWIKLGGRQKVAKEYFDKFKSWNAEGGMGGPIDETDIPKDALVDGNGDGKSPVTYQLDKNFKALLDKYKYIKKTLEEDPSYSVDNQFKTLTYTPPTPKFEIGSGGMGGSTGDEEVTLPDKVYELLNNMVAYLSNIATNTAETSTNIKNIKTIKTEIKTNKSNNNNNQSMSNDTMLDIANKQKNAKSSDAYKNARLIASGIH